MSEPPVLDHDAEQARMKLRKARRFGVIAWLAGALLLTLALLATSPSWAPGLAEILPWGKPPSYGTAGMAALQRRLDSDEAKLQTLAAAPPQDAQLASRLDALQKEIDAANAALDTLKRFDPAMLQGMNERLDRLERRASQPSDTPDRMLFLSLAQLAAAVETSRPFTAELKSSEALAIARPEIAQKLVSLEPLAASGIPGVATLAGQFSDQVAPALLRQAPAPAANAGWTQRFWDRLKSLVVIRRVGEGPTPEDPVAAAAQRAQADLAKGDLAGAVKAVEALPEPARAPAKDWLALAHQRLDAEAVLASAIQAATSALAQAPGANAP
jgi:hypothetical protein